MGCKYIGSTQVSGQYIGSTPVSGDYLVGEQIWPCGGGTPSTSSVRVEYQGSYSGNAAGVISENPASGYTITGTPGDPGVLSIGSSPVTYPASGYVCTGGCPDLSPKLFNIIFPTVANSPTIVYAQRSGGLDSSAPPTNYSFSLSLNNDLIASDGDQGGGENVEYTLAYTGTTGGSYAENTQISGSWTATPISPYAFTDGASSKTDSFTTFALTSNASKILTLTGTLEDTTPPSSGTVVVTYNAQGLVNATATGNTNTSQNTGTIAGGSSDTLTVTGTPGDTFVAAILVSADTNFSAPSGGWQFSSSGSAQSSSGPGPYSDTFTIPSSGTTQESLTVVGTAVGSQQTINVTVINNIDLGTSNLASSSSANSSITQSDSGVSNTGSINNISGKGGQDTYTVTGPVGAQFSIQAEVESVSGFDLNFTQWTQTGQGSSTSIFQTTGDTFSIPSGAGNTITYTATGTTQPTDEEVLLARSPIINSPWQTATAACTGYNQGSGGQYVEDTAYFSADCGGSEGDPADGCELFWNENGVTELSSGYYINLDDSELGAYYYSSTSGWDNTPTSC
mgnify:CR=1 FL=1